MPNRIDTSLIYRALILTGLVLFGFYLAADRGLVALALDSDRSYISWVILVVYALASCHWLWSSLQLTRERQRFSDLEEARLRGAPNVVMEDGLLGEFFTRLGAKSDGEKGCNDSVRSEPPRGGGGGTRWFGMDA